MLLVKERGRISQIVDRLVVVIDLAKAPAQGFAPLKAVLESISVFYAKHQVFSDVLLRILL